MAQQLVHGMLHTGLSYSWHHPRKLATPSSRSAWANHGRSLPVPKATMQNLGRDVPSSSSPCQQRICLSQPGPRGQTDLQKQDVVLISCVPSACIGHLKCTLAWRWPVDNFRQFAILELMYDKNGLDQWKSILVILVMQNGMHSVLNDTRRSH